MKKSLVMVSLVVASTSMMAMDLQYFLGAGAGASWNKSESSIQTPGYVFVNSNSTTDSDRNSSALMILKGGAILDNTHRLSFSYAPAFHSDANVHNFMAGYDYLIPVNNDSRFYVGAHAGISSFKGKDDISNFDMSGFAYGTQLGYIYDLTKNIEFEIGGMYTKHNLDKTGRILANDGTPISMKLEVKDAISTFAGINYKF